MDGAGGVVLVADGRAEQRHEAVPEELVDCALVAVDLRQHQLEGAVHQRVDVLGIEAPIVFGHSFGGMVALGLAIRYPELPSKLVISNSAAKFCPDRALDMFERLGGPDARAAAEAYFLEPSEERLEEFMAVCYPLYGPVSPDPEARARIVARPEVGIHYFSGEINTFDWFPELGRIACPTLVLGGELDPITPFACSEEMAAAIPRARLEVVAGAGHAPFRDRPGDTLGVIREFVRSSRLDVG